MLSVRYRDLADEYQQHDKDKVFNYLEQLSQTGRPLYGYHQPHQWVGFGVLQVLVEKCLSRALDHGCESWDVILLRLLEFLMQSACSS